MIHNIFKQRIPPLLGLDISTSAVRLLALDSTSRGFRVESCAQVRLPHGAVAEGSVADAEAVARAVGEALTRAGSKRRRVALAVSGSQIISRQIAMPVDFSDADIEQQITLESDQYIPYPLDDVYFDFVVLGPNARNPQTADVLLIVARNEVVDKRLEPLSAAGLAAAVVDVEAYALESAFPLIAPQMPPTARTGVTAMVDVGASTTTLNVLQGGVTLFTREQSFGGEQLLQQIQERYGLAYPEASAALLEGSFPEEWRSTIIEPFLDSLANQVGRLLQVFFSATGQSSLDHIVLSGGCAGLAGAAGIVGRYLGLDTRVGNPFLGVEFAPGIDAARLREHGHAWMIAAGLAMRSTTDVSR
ncbi:type IV pilus assembly protein PilM [Immundisolibacter sp.]|uniref:type IV pilus assembly protein PilM n=1 Tax=Immundisolibacter sp. TaxID=1934948 RepID=UPI0019885102|nr:type IV pilus assembly protein PilM [Immundisolibacter sp.]MBC7162390.1 type IV pilus assembly protein PilM [Immundisolibacter sp.]